MIIIIKMIKFDLQVYQVHEVYTVPSVSRISIIVVKWLFKLFFLNA